MDTNTYPKDEIKDMHIYTFDALGVRTELTGSDCSFESSND